MNQHTKPAPRNRILAGVLCLVYIALMALAFYLEDSGGVDRWPSWVLWMGGVAWGAVMVVLPFLVVKYFFGMDLSHLRRFTLRGMLLGVFYISVFVWYFTQMEWLRQRQQWRRNNPAVARSTQSQASPGLLWLLGEQGESWIEIKNGTQKQLAEAKRLFPEATVVVAGEARDGSQAVPADAPVEPQAVGRN